VPAGPLIWGFTALKSSVIRGSNHIYGMMDYHMVQHTLICWHYWPNKAIWAYFTVHLTTWQSGNISFHRQKKDTDHSENFHVENCLISLKTSARWRRVEGPVMCHTCSDLGNNGSMAISPVHTHSGCCCHSGEENIVSVTEFWPSIRDLDVWGIAAWTFIIKQALNVLG
jgi:hypothetical protein